MTEKKKREKVNAEITAAHLVQFAHEVGAGMTHEEAVAFLNRHGRAYDMWKRMMHAGEEYVKQTLRHEASNSVHTRSSGAASRCLMV